MSIASHERVESSRLICERLRSEHRDELLRLVLDPTVARWTEADGRPAPEHEVIGWLQAKDEHWAHRGRAGLRSAPARAGRGLHASRQPGLASRNDQGWVCL